MQEIIVMLGYFRLVFSQKKAVTIPDEIWSAATESGVSNVDFSKNLLQDIPLK